MHEINDRERAFGSLLLNQMSFEYAHDHCNLPYPEVNFTMLSAIQAIGVPSVFNQVLRSYESTHPPLRRMSIATQCFTHFSNIRHNLIHANKAQCQDDETRLEDLLAWAAAFATEVFDGGSDFSLKASYAKKLLGIENL